MDDKGTEALEKIMAGKMPSLSEALTMKRHSNMVGVEMNTIHVLKLFRKMARSGKDTKFARLTVGIFEFDRLGPVRTSLSVYDK